MSYHKPSLAYNLDQLLRIAGKEATSSCMENVIPRSRQEVRGVKEWEGIYIDGETFKQMAEILKEKGDITIHQRLKGPNQILLERFSSTVVQDTIILVTKRFEYNMLYMRRADGFMNWHPFLSHSTYISPEDSIAKCRDLQMSELQTTISTLLLESRELISLWRPPLDIDWDSDATSIKTTVSFNSDLDEDSDDDFKFRFRKPGKRRSYSCTTETILKPSSRIEAEAMTEEDLLENESLIGT